MNEEQIKKLIDERVKKIVPEYLKTQAFTARKLTDTPTDRYQVTPMGYVNLSSNLGARPIASVASTGQFFFNTTSNQPMWFDGTNWRNGVASVIANG